MNAGVKRYGLIGNPVAHSLSPFIMKRAFSENGIEAEYDTFKLEPESFGASFCELTASVSGLNVTYPFKEIALPYVDTRSPAVDVIGATNTLTITKRRIEAHNTDAAGTATALRSIAGIDPKDRSVFIFGAGGAARAACFGLLEAGASAVCFGVRNTKTAEKSTVRLRQHFANHSMTIAAFDTPEITEALRSAEIVINATPVGMKGHSGVEPITGENWIHQDQRVFDFVYHPLETPLLKTARACGAATVNGTALLVALNHETFHMWTGKRFSIQNMYDAVQHELRRRENE